MRERPTAALAVVGSGGWIGLLLAIVAMSETERENLLGSRGWKIGVERTTAAKATSRSKGIADLSSCFLFFDSVDGADFLAYQNAHSALRAREKDQLSLSVAAATALIAKLPKR